ncbi:MAG TPA: phosphohydrolase [Flavobacteriales bacterium]|nr:phosphohydrolase [Flavobacteriales bacterium]
MTAENLNRARAFAKAFHTGEGTGHDWWHIKRVVEQAKLIAQHERNADQLLVQLIGLLHDVPDRKLHSSEDEGQAYLLTWLRSQFDEQQSRRLLQCINEISFKGAGVDDFVSCKEVAIVQDADRLDALGAIGIARAFAYGGKKNRALFDPDIYPEIHLSYEAYKISEGHTINHFYEKLLLLEERMHTETGRQIAHQRTIFMKSFLRQFYNEWGVEWEV